MTRVEMVQQVAFPASPPAHEFMDQRTVVRVLAAALDAAEQSPQLSDEWLRAVCEQARQLRERGLPARTVREKAQ